MSATTRTSNDVTRQVREITDASEGTYDVAGITAEIIADHGPVDLDDLDPSQVWPVVMRHATDDDATGEDIATELIRAGIARDTLTVTPDDVVSVACPGGARIAVGRSEGEAFGAVYGFDYTVYSADEDTITTDWAPTVAKVVAEISRIVALAR